MNFFNKLKINRKPLSARGYNMLIAFLVVCSVGQILAWNLTGAIIALLTAYIVLVDRECQEVRQAFINLRKQVQLK